MRLRGARASPVPPPRAGTATVVGRQRNPHTGKLVRLILTGTTAILAVSVLSVMVSAEASYPLVRAIDRWIKTSSSLAWISDVNARQALTATSASALILLAAALYVRGFRSWQATFRHDKRAHDLLYYLGFIGTLSGLGAAALTLVMTGKQESKVTMLVAQNGVALMTTLVGLLGRNLLSYLYPPRDTVPMSLADIEAASSAVGRFGTAVSGVNDRLSTLTATVATTGSAIEAQKEPWETFGRVAEQTRAQLGTAADGIAGVAGSLGTLSGQLSGSVNLVGQLASTTDQVARSAGQSSVSMESFASAVATAMDSASRAASALGTVVTNTEAAAAATRRAAAEAELAATSTAGAWPVGGGRGLGQPMMSRPVAPGPGYWGPPPTPVPDIGELMRDFLSTRPGDPIGGAPANDRGPFRTDAAE